MRSILKYTVLAVFCGFFMMQSVATAQDKPAPEKAEKAEKADKTDKTKTSEKSDKTEGLAPVTLKDLVVDFPDVNGWEKNEIQKYPTEELGFSIDYESREGGKVTIYVYNGGRKSISNDLSDKAVKGELDNAKSEIRKVADMGYYENVKEVKNDTITLGGSGGKVKALRTLYNLSAGGRDLTSEIYIFAHQNRFIKIRATRLRDKDETGNKAVVSLLSEIDKMFSK